ncbi:MAG: flagellar filament outer layer protein FlaA [Spirochaetales bacterium]
MKRIVLVTLMIGAGFSFLTAQQDEVDASQIGRDTAQQSLQEISISKFEDSGFWRVYMPLDQGVIQGRRFEGSPAEKEPLEEEEAIGIATPDVHVLGVKASFFRRDNSEIYVQPIRPLQVPGITKTISVWVVGRNFNHDLYVIVGDYFGNVNTLRMGTMNHSGWRQMVAAVPPTLVQSDPNYSDRRGLQIMGFMIKPALLETYGTYYVYFDDLRALTDLFPEESRDEDDMLDAW